MDVHRHAGAGQTRTRRDRRRAVPRPTTRRRDTNRRSAGARAATGSWSAHDRAARDPLVASPGPWRNPSAYRTVRPIPTYRERLAHRSQCIHYGNSIGGGTDEAPHDHRRRRHSAPPRRSGRPTRSIDPVSPRLLTELAHLGPAAALRARAPIPPRRHGPAWPRLVGAAARRLR